jgi:uncharacterized protein (DUF1778 family)
MRRDHTFEPRLRRTGDVCILTCRNEEELPRISACFVQRCAVQCGQSRDLVNKELVYEMARTGRSRRLDLRVAPEEKELIDRAAALTGINTTDFIRGTTLAAAREAIRTHEVIKLTAGGSRVFVEALINPPQPNEHLRALAEELGAAVGR